MRKGASCAARLVVVTLIFGIGVISVLLFQTLSAPNIDANIYGPEYFLHVAESSQPISDKVTTHRYDIMYGTFLFPFVNRFRLENKKLKFLEIGLGCDMVYGPGASILLWKKIFQGQAHIWSAEVDHQCVEKYQSSPLLQDVHVLVGDQGQDTHLSKWIAESGKRTCTWY